MNEPLATKIRKILEQRGFSQTAIARKAGYSRQDLSYMLNGRKIINEALDEIERRRQAAGPEVEEMVRPRCCSTRGQRKKNSLPL